MSEKRWCPGCDSYTSDLLRAVEDGEPCPYCGLSAATIAEVDAVQVRRADEDLKSRLEAALIEADRLRAENCRLESYLKGIQKAIQSEVSR